MKKKRKRIKKMKKMDSSINELGWLDEENKESFRENIPIHDLSWFPDFQFLNQNPQKSFQKKKKGKKNKPLLFTDPFELSFEYNSFDQEQPTVTNRNDTDRTDQSKTTKNKQLKMNNQFNNSAFKMNMDEKSTEVFIFFETPYKNTDYVLVAMTNSSHCFASLKEKTAEYAVIEVFLLENDDETREEIELHGLLSWIAMGETN